MVVPNKMKSHLKLLYSENIIRSRHKFPTSSHFSAVHIRNRHPPSHCLRLVSATLPLSSPIHSFIHPLYASPPVSHTSHSQPHPRLLTHPSQHPHRLLRIPLSHKKMIVIKRTYWIHADPLLREPCGDRGHEADRGEGGVD